MVEENDKKEDKFEFDYAGEARGYISLDQARVLAMRTAMEAPGDYGRRFQGVPMAFDVVEESDTEDHYVITLSFCPQGEYSGTPGQEQFYIEKEGTVAVRQIRGLPRPAGGRRLPVLVIVVGVVLLIAGAGVGAVSAAGGFGGGDVEKPAPFGLIPTPTLSPSSTPVTGGIASGQPGAAGFQPLGVLASVPADRVQCAREVLDDERVRELELGIRLPDQDDLDKTQHCFPQGFPSELLEPSPPVGALMATLGPGEVDCLREALSLGAVSDFAFGFRQPTREEIDQIRQCFPEGVPIELKEAGQRIAGMPLEQLDCVRKAIGEGPITELSLGIRGPEEHEVEGIQHCFPDDPIDQVKEILVGLIVLRYESDLGCVVASVGEQMAREIGIGGRPVTIEEVFAISQCLPEHVLRQIVEERVVLSFDADEVCVVKALDHNVGLIRELGPGGRLPSAEEINKIQHCFANGVPPELLQSFTIVATPTPDAVFAAPTPTPAPEPEAVIGATEPTSTPVPEPVVAAPTPVPGGGLTRGGTISGTLKDEFTGDPIPDVEVLAELADDGFTSSGYTDRTGAYAIVGLPEGDYRIMTSGVEHLGYLSGFYRDTQRREEADLVPVGPAEDVTSIDFTLQTGATITGRVTDQETGFPISNVQVGANEEQSGFGPGTRTDFDGRYELTGLGTGRYRVRAKSDDGRYAREYYDGKVSWEYAAVITIRGREEVTGVDFTLGAAATITGRVTDQGTGFPVSNIQIDANLVDGSFGAGGRTDFDGRYALRGLVEGRYRVGVNPEDTGYVGEYYNDKLDWDDADFVTVGEGAEVANVDFGLSRGATITGTVIDGETGQPIFDLEIRVIYDGGDVCCAVSNFNGEYAVSGVPEGAVDVEVGGQAYVGQKREIIIDGPQEVRGFNFTLFTGATISGRVFDAESGGPLAGAWIDAQLDGGGGGFGTGADEEGRYALQALPPGRYIIQAELRSEGYAATYFNDKPSYDRADVIDIAGREDVTDVHFGLSIGGTISGTVLDVATGIPVVGVEISASHEETGAWSGTRTDSDGRYVLRGLGAGEYRIQFGPEQGYLVQYFRNQPIWDDADLAVVRDREDVDGINFGLLLGANVSGRIMDGATGLPIRGMDVGARLNGNDVAWGTTDSERTYLLEAIPDGEIEIFVYGQGYLEQSRFITVRDGNDVRGVDF